MRKKSNRETFDRHDRHDPGFNAAISATAGNKLDLAIGLFQEMHLWKMEKTIGEVVCKVFFHGCFHFFFIFG